MNDHEGFFFCFFANKGGKNDENDENGRGVKPRKEYANESKG